MWHALRICLAAIAVVAAPAIAAEGGKSAGENHVQISDSLRIELVAQPRELEIPSRFFLALRVVNASPGNVLFNEFSLRSLEEPGGLKIKDNCSGNEQQYIASATSTTIMCEVLSDGFDDSFRGFLVSMLRSWSLLTLSPGEYRFVGTATATTDDQIRMTANTVIPVRIRPTVWQVCLGASFGALLLVVFAFSSPRLRAFLSIRDHLKDCSWWRMWIVEPLLLWIGACVAGAMFIFMTYRLKDVSGPFTVTVNDFYGGIVIGLFGVFLADKLAERFFGKTEASESGGAPQ